MIIGTAVILTAIAVGLLAEDTKLMQKIAEFIDNHFCR